MSLPYIPEKLDLRIICPTHGRDPVPETCQSIRQYRHVNCGGGRLFIHIKSGNLTCSKCTTNSHISNFEFECAAKCKFQKFKMFQGEVVMNLFNQSIGHLSDDDAFVARKLFKSLWRLD